MVDYETLVDEENRLRRCHTLFFKRSLCFIVFYLLLY